MNMLANMTNYDNRIAAGRAVEKSIVNQLRQKGHRFDPPTVQQDKEDKIDGIYVSKNGQRYTVQIKFRETGDDIIFEIVKNWDQGTMGRDLKSKADLYLVADRTGLTRLFYTKPIKEKAKEILAMVDNEPDKDRWAGNGWEAKIQQDRATKETKLMAYFDPKAFETLFTWQLSI